MASCKRSKARRNLKKGQEGNRKSVQKMIDDAKKDLSRTSSSSHVNNSLQVPTAVGSPSTFEKSMNALSMTQPVTFSQTVKPLAPSPPKRKPVINLTENNAFRSKACITRERTSSGLRRYFNCQAKPPRTVVPGLPQDSRCRDPDYLIKDQRHENGGLVHLPKEPDIKRTPNFVRKGHFRFLDLPPEIRNQIYSYHIEPDCYAIRWDSQGHRGKQLTHRLPQRSNACQPRLSHSTRQRRLDLKRNPRSAERAHLMSDLYHNCSSVALSWVCKKMYGEASSMFYSKSTFIFEGIGPLRHFLNNMTPQNKASITKLKLIYKAYGHPAKTENRIWKVKADRKWEDLCWRISYECTAVTHLILDLDYGYSKLQFVPLFDVDGHAFGTEWRYPLWAFEDFDLKSCACRLRSATTSETVLEVESYKIRQALLGDAWNDEAERERDAFGARTRHKDSKQRKAVGVLRVTQTGEVFGLA